MCIESSHQSIAAVCSTQGAIDVLRGIFAEVCAHAPATLWSWTAKTTPCTCSFTTTSLTTLSFPDLKDGACRAFWPGSDGTPGSASSTNPLAGGNGANGQDGSPGGNGTDGWPGQTVHVSVTLQPGPRPLIQVRAKGDRDERFFLIDPEGGSLSIDAFGGDGGHAGRGGRGGRGGSGGIGSPNGTAGNSGLDGSDGQPGSEGKPGKIIVTIDPAAEAFRDKLHFATRRGAGAGAGAEFHTESVPPLW